jgi:hypothetical protein
MSSNFESIFNKNTKVNSTLNGLFKIDPSKTEKPSLVLPKPTKITKNGKKMKKVIDFDPNSEKRTIFIGNLVNTAKKEVLYFIF